MKRCKLMKMLFGVMLTGCLLSCTIPLQAKNDIGVPEVFDEDSLEKNSLNVQKTIDAIKARIEEEPDNYEHYYSLAFVCDYAGRHEEALEALKGELECYPGPDWHVVYYNLARTYMDLDKLEEGKAYLDKAMKCKPDDIYNNALLMDYSILRKDYSQAATQMKILSEVAPQRDWYQESFLKFYDKEDGEEYDFAALYSEALAKNPDNHYAIRTHALMLRNKGDDEFLKNYDFIMSELKRAYRLKPDYVFHSVGIANTYLWKWTADKNKRDLRQALQWMMKARKREPENYKVLSGLGYVYLNMEQYDKAIRYLEKGVALGKDGGKFSKMLAQAYNGKAYFCYKKGKNLDVGMELIEKALIYEPNDGMINSTKAELLYALGRYEEAYEYITKAIALEPGFAEMEQDLENIKKAMEENIHSPSYTKF